MNKIEMPPQVFHTKSTAQNTNNSYPQSKTHSMRTQTNLAKVALKALCNVREITQHIDNIAKSAKEVGEGKLINASFGQDPVTGGILSPKVNHFRRDVTEEIIKNIQHSSSHLHRNIYMPLVLMRQGLPAGKKGCEQDIYAALGLVADFDDSNAWNWKNRIPSQPSYVLETSPGRFQVGFLFDTAVAPAKAKELAVTLKKYCDCDHGTADISHVWRIPGTLNWPNRKKVEEGRSTEPFVVRYIEVKS